MNDLSPESVFSIGSVLQRARLKANISLERMSTETRIRLKYLQAIEDDNFAILPGEVTAKGFIKICAEYLGCNTASLLQQFSSPLDSPRQEALTESPLNRTSPDLQKKRLVIPNLVWLASGIILAVVLGGTMLWRFYFSEETALAPTRSVTSPSQKSEAPKQTTPAGVIVNEYAETPTKTNSIEEKPKSLKPKFVKVKVFASQGAWVRVYVDGVDAFHGVMNEGESRIWQGYSQILVRSPEAKSIHLSFNNRDVGVLGYSDKISQRKFNAEEIE